MNTAGRTNAYGLLVAGMVMSSAGIVPSAGHAAPLPRAQSSVALVAMGVTNAGIVDRVADFVTARTGIPVEILPARPAPEGGLGAAGEIGAGIKKEHHICVVVLDYPSEKSSGHGAVYPERSVAVVNVRALMNTAGLETKDSGEVIRRRVERGVMRGIGFCLGLKPCPYPYCVLTDYETLEELDQMSRDFCPPCLERLHKKARRLGVVLRKKNIPHTGFPLKKVSRPHTGKD